MGSQEEEEATMKKPHAVCVPYPAQGHVTPFLQLAKLLHSRGFHITFVNTEFNHNRLIKNKGPDSVKGLPDFRFETIPDGLPPSGKDATQDIPLLCDSTRKNCLGPIRELLVKLNSSGDVPRVSCVISDGTMNVGVKAAKELGIPHIQLWTASACSFLGYLSFRDLIRKGILPFRDQKLFIDGTLDTPINLIPGLKNMRQKDIPNYIKLTASDQDTLIDFMGEEAHACLESSVIIFNTFDALEQEALDAISSMSSGDIYTVGPLAVLTKNVPINRQIMTLSSSLWKEDSRCLEWLDQRLPSSVIYVNYGSITVMSALHLEEFAWGLANSKHPFLWVIRPDLLKDDSVILPEHFIEETKNRGLIVSWCPQEKVLSHPSIGAYLTHCGWNSMTETLTAGIPVICWPFFADQFPNCRYACTEWGIGLEVGHDVKREEIEGLVKDMMGGEKGREMRSKARDWKKKVEDATANGGSSYDSFDRLIQKLFHVRK